MDVHGAKHGDQAAQVVLRPLSTAADYAQCLELQRETWGSDFTELVPPAMLMISQKVGGVAAGAFDTADRMLGFVYGVSGVRQGRLAHWSHMLAVRHDVEGMGIGRRLKAYQRQLLLDIGIEVAYWTYDPLVARNAHLNLNRLGAHAVEYVANMYGDDTQSRLDSGLGTDRFVIEWSLNESRVHQALEGTATLQSANVPGAPVVNTVGAREPEPMEAADLPLHPVLQIEIPADIQQVKNDSVELGRRWRNSTRRAFLCYLERGYRVEGFRRDAATNRCLYLLRQPD